MAFWCIACETNHGGLGASQVVNNLGIRHGLYRGWVPTCLSRMSNYAYFGPYEYFRRSFGMNRTVEGEKSLLQSMAASIAAGGLAGVCYWCSCYPLDVIKNRLQVCSHLF